jgi:hypothetical protein
MSIEDDDNAVVGRWFTECWGPHFNPEVIDETQRGGSTWLRFTVFMASWDVSVCTCGREAR